MKKFAIAGGVLAVAVLVGYMGTTMVLKGDNFLAQGATLYFSGAAGSGVNSKPCGDCKAKEQVFKDAQENLNMYAYNFANDILDYDRISGENIKPSKERLKAYSDALINAKRDLEQCKKTCPAPAEEIRKAIPVKPKTPLNPREGQRRATSSPTVR